MPDEQTSQPPRLDIHQDADSGEPLAGSGFEDETPDPEYDTGETEEEAQ